jgi:hypothetical protein
VSPSCYCWNKAKKLVNELTVMSDCPTINLVCTRCVDSNHLSLQRWYADHVHLLLAAPSLRQAQLFRRAEPLMGQPPNYFCMYAFASMADFDAFEHGQPKAHATELTNAAAGRSSIDIVQRHQFERWLHRSWPAPHGVQGSAWRLAAYLASDAPWALPAQRWWADHLQALQACAPVLRAQMFTQRGDTARALLLLDVVGDEPHKVWRLLQEQIKQPALHGAAQHVQTQWAMAAQGIQSWMR